MLETFFVFVLYGIGAVVLVTILGGLLFLILLFIPSNKAAKKMLHRLPKHRWLTKKEIQNYGFSPIITTEALGLLRLQGKVMTKEIDSLSGEGEPTKEKIYMLPAEVHTDRSEPYIRA